MKKEKLAVTKCNQRMFEFPHANRRIVEANFAGGDITSGFPPMREPARRSALIERALMRGGRVVECTVPENQQAFIVPRDFEFRPLCQQKKIEPEMPRAR